MSEVDMEDFYSHLIVFLDKAYSLGKMEYGKYSMVFDFRKIKEDGLDIVEFTDQSIIFSEKNGQGLANAINDGSLTDGAKKLH